jgi:acyl-coenzyme A synthetase/AMP-(fatty) acid ligase
VHIFYTAPTAIRSLIKAAESDEKVHPDRSDLSSLRILGSVGEPINPEAWMWYYKNIGHEKCPIVDTFWQTETGGHMMTPLPGATPLVPGSCTLPLPGIMAAIVDEVGNDIPNGTGGILVVKRPWPSMIRTIWNDPSVSRTAISPPKWVARCTWPATAQCAAPTVATSASPAVLMTCSTCLGTAWAPWKLNRRWWPRPIWWPKLPWWDDQTI